MVCVASNAFGRGHMKARVLEFVGCHDILWKSVLTFEFFHEFLGCFLGNRRMVPLGGTWSLSKKQRESKQQEMWIKWNDYTPVN